MGFAIWLTGNIDQAEPLPSPSILGPSRAMLMLDGSVVNKGYMVRMLDM